MPVYDIVPTPIGPLLIVGTPITTIAFDGEDWDDILAKAGTAEHREHTDARHQFSEYFEGRRTVFSLDYVPASSTTFRNRVRDLLTGIPYGQTRTYQEIARALDTNATRAVGSACGANALPLLIPCHRVVRSDGSLGEYRGGLEAKRHLLQLEGSRTA